MRVPSPRDHVAISRGRRLVEALAAVAPRYAPDDQQRKRALLTELEGCAIRHVGTLLRLHETLCFLQAYPDDAKTLELVDRALEAFAARVERLGPPARRRLHDSGVTDTTLDYPFGFPMARWLAARFPRQSDVAWAAFTDEDRLDETLSLLATTAEGDFSIITKAQADRLAKVMPVAGAAFSDWVLFAMTLEDLLLVSEARPLWKKLSAERPDEPKLRQFADR